MRRIEPRRPMTGWRRMDGRIWRSVQRAEGLMSSEERTGDTPRPFARPFARDEEPASAGSPTSAARSASPGRATRHEAPSTAPKPKHAQMVFITPLGIPIGPSVQEELHIPDDLNDTLPPGDFPGQLLLDLGLR